MYLIGQKAQICEIVVFYVYIIFQKHPSKAIHITWVLPSGAGYASTGFALGLSGAGITTVEEKSYFLNIFCIAQIHKMGTQVLSSEILLVTCVLGICDPL